MTRNLEGKVAWVTGSARGIGKAIARALAEQGASVAVTDIDGDTAKTTATELAKDFAVKSIAAPLDVTDAAGIESIIKQIQAELEMPQYSGIRNYEQNFKTVHIPVMYDELTGRTEIFYEVQ